MIGSIFGEVEQKTYIGFRDFGDFETYINALESDYDSEDFIFTKWVYKLNTPEFDKINRSQYGEGTDFKQKVNEYTGNNCLIPTSGNRFIKCNTYLTGKD